MAVNNFAPPGNRFWGFKKLGIAHLKMKENLSLFSFFLFNFFSLKFCSITPIFVLNNSTSGKQM